VTLIVVAPTTAATEPSAASTAAATRFFFGARFVDFHGAPAEIAAVECGDGFGCRCGIGHFYECESARTSGVAIGDDADALDCAMRLEKSTQFRFSGAVRDVAYKQILHSVSFSGTTLLDTGLSDRRGDWTSKTRFFRWTAAIAAAGLSIRTVFGFRCGLFRRGHVATRRGGISLQREEKRAIAEAAGNLHLAEYVVLRFVAIDA
jgi:hypothetical protein